MHFVNTCGFYLEKFMKIFLESFLFKEALFVALSLSVVTELQKKDSGKS